MCSSPGSGTFTNHLGPAIRLCKLAGKNCENIEFSFTESQSSRDHQRYCNGYILKLTEHKSITLESYDDLNDFLESAAF